MMLVSLFFLMLAISASDANPCLTAQVINQPERSTNYNATNLNARFCDRELKPGWYRFMDGLRSIKLADTCQPLYHCNTDVPIWMRGGHPTAIGKSEQKEVCAPTPEQGDCTLDDCDWHDVINVMFCKSNSYFYVYELVPTPGCHMAYCAGNGSPCQLHQTSQHGSCTDKFPLMPKDPQLSNPIVTAISANGMLTSFKFDCKVEFDQNQSNVGFEIGFLFDDQPDPKIPAVNITGFDRNVSLPHTKLRSHMGQVLSCYARSYFHPRPQFLSPHSYSNSYWVGITPNTTRLEVGEKDPPQNLTMYSTVPIVCAAGSSSCELVLDFDPINNHALGAVTFVKGCNVTLRSEKWNYTANKVESTFLVAATRDGKNDKDKEIFLHFNATASFSSVSPIFFNYQVPFVQIISKNTATATCWCVADPHCKTLDSPDKSKSILDYYLPGEFVMYKSKSTHRYFEVQVRTWSCNGNGPTCNCGVAMKENNEVVILDMCHTQIGTSYPVLRKTCNSKMSNGTAIDHDNARTNYLINFPSGAQVKVENFEGKWLNIYITAPEIDLYNTEGICGYFDHDASNDLRHSDKKQSKMGTDRFQDDDFVNSWRIQQYTSMFESNYTFDIDPNLVNDMFFCMCQADSGNTSTFINCTQNGNLAKAAIDASRKALIPGGIQPGTKQHVCSSAGRHKRAATTLLADDFPADYYFDYGLTYVPTLRANFPTEHGKSRADAEAACNSAIDQNPVVQQCVLKAGLDFAAEKSNCVEDFKYFDDGDFVRSHMLSAITKCIYYVLKNESFYDANDNLPAFISSDLCPAYDCNNHGTCTHGQCICDAGFVGNACEIQSSRAPLLYGVVKTTLMTGSVLCDVTERICETAYVYGNNVFDNPRLSCKVEVLKFDGHSFAPSGIQLTTAAIYKSIHEVGCKLPLKSTIGGQTVVAFNISVTNDAISFSNEVTYVRTDKRCMSCVVTGESCSVKSGSCLIESNCWTAGETNPSNCSQICDPATNNTQWKTAHIISTSTAAGVGGNCLHRFDIWTYSRSGCNCSHDPGNYTCACCDAGGCQCNAPFQNQCTQCGKPAKCGSPQPAPEYGIDGYTNMFDDCTCQYNTTLTNCACCQHGINACQCGKKHRNQCVDCSHMEQCGSKPWIFGPPIIDP